MPGITPKGTDATQETPSRDLARGSDSASCRIPLWPGRVEASISATDGGVLFRAPPMDVAAELKFISALACLIRGAKPTDCNSQVRTNSTHGWLEYERALEQTAATRLRTICRMLNPPYNYRTRLRSARNTMQGARISRRTELHVSGTRSKQIGVRAFSSSHYILSAQSHSVGNGAGGTSRSNHHNHAKNHARGGSVTSLQTSLGRYHARQDSVYLPTVSGRSDQGDDYLYTMAGFDRITGQSQRRSESIFGLTGLPDDMYDYDLTYETLNRLGQENVEHLFSVTEELLARTEAAHEDFTQRLAAMGVEDTTGMAFSLDPTGASLADMFNEAIESALYLKAFPLAFGLFNVMRCRYGLLPSSYVYSSITHVDMREKVALQGAIANVQHLGEYSAAAMGAGPNGNLSHGDLALSSSSNDTIQDVPECLKQYGLSVSSIELDERFLPNNEVETEVMGCGAMSIQPLMRVWHAPGIYPEQDSSASTTQNTSDAQALGISRTRLPIEDYLDLVCDDLNIAEPSQEFVRNLTKLQSLIDPLGVSTWSVDLIRTCPKEVWDNVRPYFLLFAEMRRNSIQPDAVIYNMLLRVCAETGLWRPALGLVQEMALSSYFMRTYSYLLIRMNAQMLCQRAVRELQTTDHDENSMLMISKSAAAALALTAGQSEETAIAILRGNFDAEDDASGLVGSKLALYSSSSRPPFMTDPIRAQKLVSTVVTTLSTLEGIPMPEPLRSQVSAALQEEDPWKAACSMIHCETDPALSNWIIEVFERLSKANLFSAQDYAVASSLFTQEQVSAMILDRQALEAGMIPPSIFEHATIEALGRNGQDDTSTRAVWGFALLPDVYTLNMLLQTLAAAKQPYLALSLLETWFRDTPHGQEYVARYGDISQHGKIREAHDSGDTGAANIFRFFNPDGTRRVESASEPTSKLQRRLELEASLRLNPEDLALQQQLAQLQKSELSASSGPDTDVGGQLPQTALHRRVDDALNRIEIPLDDGDLSKLDEARDVDTSYQSAEAQRKRDLWSLTAQEQAEYDAVSSPEAVTRAAEAARQARKGASNSPVELSASAVERAARDAEEAAEAALQRATELQTQLAQLGPEDPKFSKLQDEVKAAVQSAQHAVVHTKEKARLALQLANSLKSPESDPNTPARGKEEAVMPGDVWVQSAHPDNGNSDAGSAPPSSTTSNLASDPSPLSSAGVLSFHERQLQRSLARSNFSVTARTGVEWWSKSFELCVPAILPDPTSLSYGIVFMSLIDHEDYAQALDLACRMLLRDHPLARPDANMLNWCCRSAREVHDWERAFWIIDTTRRLDIKPLPTSYLNALAACIEPESIYAEAAALRILAYAKRDGVPITVSMYTTAIAAMKSWRHAVALLMELHDTMNLPALVMPYTAAVHVCTKGGKLSSAYKLIMYAKSKGMPKEDIQVLFETLLDAATKYKYSADVHQLLERIRDQQVDVTPRVMAALMRVSRNSEDFGSALKLYGTAVLQDRLDLLVFSSLIQVFTRSRLWGEASGVFLFYDFMTRGRLESDMEWNPDFQFDCKQYVTATNTFIERLSQGVSSADKLAEMGIKQLLLRLPTKVSSHQYRNEDISFRLDAARVFTVLSVLHWTLSMARNQSCVPPWMTLSMNECSGAIPLPRPDVRLYNDGALSLIRARQPASGLKVYEFMRDCGDKTVQPTSFTYDMLVAALYQTSRVVEAVRLYREGLASGVVKPIWNKGEVVINPSKHSIFTAVLAVRVIILDLLDVYKSIEVPADLAAQDVKGQRDHKRFARACADYRKSKVQYIIPDDLMIVCGSDASPNLPMMEAIEWSLGHRFPRKISTYRGTVDGSRLSGALIVPRDALLSWLEDITRLNLSEEALYTQHNYTRSEMRAKRDRIEQRMAIQAAAPKVNLEFKEDGTISQKIEQKGTATLKPKSYQELEAERRAAAKAWNFAPDAQGANGLRKSKGPSHGDRKQRNRNGSKSSNSKRTQP